MSKITENFNRAGNFIRKSLSEDTKRSYFVETGTKDKLSSMQMLLEKGQVDFADNIWDAESIGIKNKELAKKIQKVPYDFDLYLACFKKIPKVQRAVNTRANFAIQGGFRLIGNEEDTEKLKKWSSKVHLDNHLMQQAKEMILFGNVYIYPVGSGDSLELKYLPVSTMRVVREPTAEHLGFVQIHDRKIIESWNPNELYHLKWNTIGTEAYGIPEILSLIDTLTNKLKNEKLIPNILKYHLEPRVFQKMGTPEKPYSDRQISNYKGVLQNRIVGGDVLVPGDVDPVVIQPSKGIGDVTAKLTEHTENQVNIGLNMPEILIQGRSDAAASFIQMDALERADAKPIQDVLGMFLEKYIFPKVLGKDEVPGIVWNAINVETALRIARTLRQLVGTNNAPKILTIDEARELLGYKEMPESEKEVEDEPEQPAGIKPDTGREPEDG